MNPIAKVFCMISACVLLAGCGGKDEPETATAPAAIENTAIPRANNPLAREQQLIRDAKGIQAILDKDAEEKKNAVKNIN